MPHRILLGGAFLYLTTANVVWLMWDTRPGFWDMASHQTTALVIFDALRTRGLVGLAAVASASDFYPPLFHSIAAVSYGVLGISSDAARLANVPATAILMGSTYMIGRRLVTPLAGTAAAMLAAFYPIMVWLSREPMLDYWLAAMVALAFAVLLESDGFADRPMSIAFGAACGLGMLTKWTFVLFLIFPAVWLARRHRANALLAAAVAASLASIWYVPQLDRLGAFLELNRGGAAAEGDPASLSIGSIIFYLRALVSYQLFAPLALLFGVGLAVSIGNHTRKWTPLWLWLAGSWFLLLFFANKDPRYSVPLLPAVAVVTSSLIPRIQEIGRPIVRTLAVIGLAAFLLVQHHAISFGTGLVPERILLLEGGADTLHRDWVLYSQDYLDLWGPPAREDWMIDHVLDRVTEARTGGSETDAIQIGMIPDIPRFDWLAFEFRIAARRLPVTMVRLNTLAGDELLASDYILVSEGSQGYPGLIPPEAGAISEYVNGNPESFRLVEAFPIPSGDVIRLYQVRADSERVG